MSEIEILREQLQQANNLINQLVASNNALAASAVAGAGAATGAAGAAGAAGAVGTAVTGVATGVPIANPAAFPMANATAIPSMNSMAQNTQLPGVTLDDCSKTKGFIQKQMCEAKNKAKSYGWTSCRSSIRYGKGCGYGFCTKKMG